MSKKLIPAIGAVALLIALCVFYMRSQQSTISTLVNTSPSATPAPVSTGAVTDVTARSSIINSLAGVLLYGVMDTRAMETEIQGQIGFFKDLLNNKMVAEVLTSTPVKGGATTETAKQRIDNFIAWWGNLETVEIAVKRDGFTLKSGDKNVNLPSIVAALKFSSKEHANKTRAEIVAELSERATKTGKIELKKVEGSEDVEVRAHELPEVPLMKITVDDKLLRASMFSVAEASVPDVNAAAGNAKKLEEIVVAVGTSPTGLMFFQDFEQASEQLSHAAEPISDLLNLDETTRKHFVTSIKDLAEFGQRGFRLTSLGGESRGCVRPATGSIESVVSETVIQRQATKHRFLAGVDKETIFASFDVTAAGIIAGLEKLSDKTEVAGGQAQPATGATPSVSQVAISKIRADLEKLNFGELGIALNPPVIPPFIGAVVYLGSSSIKGGELLTQVATLLNDLASAVPSASDTTSAATVEGNKITFSVAGYKVTGVLEGADQNGVVFAMDESIATTFAAKLEEGRDYYGSLGADVKSYLSTDVAAVSSINGDAVVNLVNNFLPLLTMGNPQLDTAKLDPFLNRLRVSVVNVKKMEKVGADIYCTRERTFLK
jgi:hypothetical protein